MHNRKDFAMYAVKKIDSWQMRSPFIILILASIVGFILVVTANAIVRKIDSDSSLF